MKRVAIVGADFTPSSLPPALRIRFFAQHLPEFGWNPVVVTTKPDHYEWSVDPDNLALLPRTLEVVRTPALPAALTRRLGIGDIGIRTLWFHWKALARLCRDQQVDLVFIPVPPYVPMVLGRMIHRRFGIPYVIDYIDPWVSEEYWRLPRKQRPPKWPLAYALSRLLEPIALRHVAHIVGVSEGTTDSVVSRYPWLAGIGTTAIPYGGEPADFEYVRANPRPNRIFDRSDGCLHVTYVGAYVPTMEATVRALFTAVREGMDREPELFHRVRLHFVGTSYAAGGQLRLTRLSTEIGLGNRVTEHPERIPYLESLQVMLDSHVLVAVGSDAPHYTASKIFPYVLAGRPLVAVFHEASSVVSILQDLAPGSVITFSADHPADATSGQISALLQRVLALPPRPGSSAELERFDRYTTRAATARLARVFDEAVVRALPGLAA